MYKLPFNWIQSLLFLSFSFSFFLSRFKNISLSLLESVCSLSKKRSIDSIFLIWICGTHYAYEYDEQSYLFVLHFAFHAQLPLKCWKNYIMIMRECIKNIQPILFFIWYICWIRTSFFLVPEPDDLMNFHTKMTHPGNLRSFFVDRLQPLNMVTFLEVCCICALCPCHTKACDKEIRRIMHYTSRQWRALTKLSKVIKLAE